MFCVALLLAADCSTGSALGPEDAGAGLGRRRGSCPSCSARRRLMTPLPACRALLTGIDLRSGMLWLELSGEEPCRKGCGPASSVHSAWLDLQVSKVDGAAGAAAAAWWGGSEATATCLAAGSCTAGCAVEDLPGWLMGAVLARGMRLDRRKGGSSMPGFQLPTPSAALAAADSCSVVKAEESCSAG
ncbi:hypothetical protein V8C86DRAFT_2524842 [Haematococcus lacustris]